MPTVADFVARYPELSEVPRGRLEGVLATAVAELGKGASADAVLTRMASVIDPSRLPAAP